MKAEAPIGCRRCGSPVGYGPSVDRRGGIYPARGLAATQGSRDDASIVPYRGLRYRRKCGFPVGYGPSVDRRGGIYPARGRLRRRGVRRDEGIPPYGRLGGCGRPVWPVVFRGLYGRAMALPGNLTPPRGSRDDLRPKSRALRPGWPPKRACGRSASIVPYRGLRCSGSAVFPGWPRAFRRS